MQAGGHELAAIGRHPRLTRQAFLQRTGQGEGPADGAIGANPCARTVLARPGAALGGPGTCAQRPNLRRRRVPLAKQVLVCYDRIEIMAGYISDSG